ncbi:Synaptic vesicle membrane protein VAT-1 -like protein [Collichthys lucidus]|uniref:Synaptic vesicle membrane protein VAT-1-like protein n=1 Tax=Collichthys lucidus TaxID=240159 RepID=A0A4U5VNW9_COLLU|nr:Synaptic vesicle membrane protein VAT-1 -like protein [Collichthys lucidus]
MSGEEAPTQQQQPEQQEKKPDEPPPAAAAAADAPQEERSAAPAAEEKTLSFRALVLTGHGGYDKVKLQVKTQSEPRLQPGEVLVRVKACGLNFGELLGRMGMDEMLPSPPVTMGMEGSGVIEAVGEDVKERKVGDRVIVLSLGGMWQEVVVVSASRTFPMPEQMSFEEGAALSVNYVSAYLMLFEMANVRPGKSVLIHMAAVLSGRVACMIQPHETRVMRRAERITGGVGIAASQLCQTVQDVTVFGTASGSKHETIAQGGVTHLIDYRTKDYVAEIRKISPKGVDIVLDPLGGSDSQKGFSLLKPLGTLVVYGATNSVTGPKKNLLAIAKTWYNQLSLNTLKLMPANKAVCGFYLGHIVNEELVSRTMFKLLELYGQGKIKPHIDSCYHFEEVADAMRRMHERLNIGKVILLPEAKKEEEKPKSDPEPVENVEKTEAAVEEKKEEAAEEVKEEKD